MFLRISHFRIFVSSLCLPNIGLGRKNLKYEIRISENFRRVPHGAILREIRSVQLSRRGWMISVFCDDCVQMPELGAGNICNTWGTLWRNSTCQPGHMCMYIQYCSYLMWKILYECAGVCTRFRIRFVSARLRTVD